MTDEKTKTGSLKKLNHRGRASQVRIYFGKLIRMFVFQNDWKVLPLSALIAGMVAMVIRNDCFMTREGMLKGALALSCVALWNGCFNSIQVICRERDILKREHRSGMHVSSYVISHVLYQGLLCLAQAVLTLYVCRVFGVKFPKEGILMSLFSMELTVTVFLITFAADMLSLFLSSLVHSTTAAMTIMPFVLVFQLVFSGGIFSVPEQLSGVSELTISKYGMRCIAAEGGYNELPMMSGWNTLSGMRNSRLQGSFTVGQALEFLNTADGEEAEEIRDYKIFGVLRTGDLMDVYRTDPEYEELREEEIHVDVSIGEVIDTIGEETVKNAVLEKTGASAQKADYERTESNILRCWLDLGLFSLAFFFLTMVSLKFIDLDKR